MVALFRATTFGPESPVLPAEERYQIDCRADVTSYWKQSGQLNTVRQARRRCKNLILKIDPEGGAEWTIRNWEQKWRGDSKTQETSLEDRVAAAKFLERSGRHTTLMLYDADTPIAGNTHVVHKDCVVDQVKYRSPEHDYYGAGTYLVDAMFQWATRSGYGEVDMGTGHEYKKRWAPATGDYTYWFSVSPPERFRAIGRFVRRLKP